MSTTPFASTNDIFSSLLDLEDQFHREGYDLGVADGAKSGRTEGRVFGLEKGFERFLELGQLRGRAVVWQGEIGDHGNERLKKHVDRLATLTSTETLSTENNEDAVTDVEERLRDAKNKERLIKRTLGKEGSTKQKLRGEHQPEQLEVKRTGASNNSCAPSIKQARRTGEMEDFAGLPGIKKVE